MAYETNNYLKTCLGRKDLSEEVINNCKEVMNKYQNNPWWESNDPKEFAKYQIFENTLLGDFSKLQEGVEQIVDRPVYTTEFGYTLEELRSEVREAIKKKGSSIDDKLN